MTCSIKATITDLSRTLPDGVTVRALCPVCEGGRSREQSLAVTRDGPLVRYICHRAKCGEAGVLGGSGPVAALEARRPDFVPRPYPYPVRSPGPEHWVWGKLHAPGSTGLAARIGLATKAGDEEELVWELRDMDWAVTGHLSRHYPDKTIRTWRTVPGPVYGWFASRRPETVWIVEDPLSAARVQLAGQGALCLCGTGMSRELMAVLAHWHRRQVRYYGEPLGVTVALDPDATYKGRDLARALTSRYGIDTLWRPLTKDIKDMEPDELGEVLRT